MYQNRWPIKTHYRTTLVYIFWVYLEIWYIEIKINLIDIKNEFLNIENGFLYIQCHYTPRDRITLGNLSSVFLFYVWFVWAAILT